jgi:peptidoglycan-associated lipoprotein
MRLKMMSMFAAVALLAACESTPQQTNNAGGLGGGAPLGGAAGSSQFGSVRPGSQEELQQQYGDRVFFDFDKSDLTPNSRRTVEGWAAFLRQNPNVTLTIEGHCDERGTREYNLALGERRATAVKRFLADLGIDGRRVATISYGKERPAVVGSSESSYAQNRRGVALVN